MDENIFSRDCIECLKLYMYIGNLSMKSGQRQDFPELIVHGKEFGLHRDKMILVATEKDYPGSRNKMP